MMVEVFQKYGFGGIFVAEFLTTKGTSHQIDQIIINAKEKLVLVSPYLSISNSLLERLQDADRRGVEIILIYGKVKDQPGEMQRLQDLQRLSVYYHEVLHAKCYYNENDLIITSMNLHQFSEKANREMGVLVKRGEDNDIYNEATNEVQSILESAERIRLKSPSGLPALGKAFEPIRLESPRGLPAVGKAPEPVRPKSPSGLAAVGKAFMGMVNALGDDVAGTPKKGFCISCRQQLPQNPDRPFCGKCFARWNVYQNPEHREAYCHGCGKRMKVSMGKPLCLACWREDND